MSRDEFVDAVTSPDPLPGDRIMFVHAARAMRDSSWWWTIPVYAEPAPVSGEIIASDRSISASIASGSDCSS